MDSKWQIKIFKIVGLVLGVGMVISLGRGLWQLYQARGRLEKAKESYLEVEDENLKLEKRMVEVKSDGFVETQARNKLNMKLSEETILVVPEDFKLETIESLDNGESERANWKKWWELFK